LVVSGLVSAAAGCTEERVPGTNATTQMASAPDTTPGGGVLGWPKVTELGSWTLPAEALVTGFAQATDGILLLWSKETGDVWMLDPARVGEGAAQLTLAPGAIAVDRSSEGVLEGIWDRPLRLDRFDLSGALVETRPVMLGGTPFSAVRGPSSWFLLLGDPEGGPDPTRLVEIDPAGQTMLLDSTAVPLGSLTARGADVLLAEEAHPHRIFVYSGSERQVLENGRPAFFDSLTVAVKAPSVRAWKTTRVLPFEGGLLQQVVEPESAWYVLILWDRNLEMYNWPLFRRRLQYFASDTLTHSLYGLRTGQEVQVIAYQWAWTAGPG
jgi:hypothetical protein